MEVVAAAAAKSLQSCPTLCDPTEGSPLGLPVPGILQAGTLEGAAVSFSIEVVVNSVCMVDPGLVVMILHIYIREYQPLHSTQSEHPDAKQFSLVTLTKL